MCSFLFLDAFQSCPHQPTSPTPTLHFISLNWSSQRVFNSMRECFYEKDGK
jgi:hypothetical protein